MLSANAKRITVNIVYILFHTTDLPNHMRNEYKQYFWLIFHLSSIKFTVSQTVKDKYECSDTKPNILICFAVGLYKCFFSEVKLNSNRGNG